MGALFFDVDGDRDLDVFVANYGANKLYLNDGTGRFTDVTLAAGVPQDERWHAAVCAADYDRDGDLDLYVTSYLDYDPAKMPPADELGRYQREDPMEMLPFAFPGERKQLLRNDRIKSGPTDASAPRDPSQPNAQALSFRFTDVTATSGVRFVHSDGSSGRRYIVESVASGLATFDYDGDGDIDLYFLSGTPLPGAPAEPRPHNALYRNDGNWKFTDVTQAAGVGDAGYGLGVCVGDYNNDGYPDLYVNNFGPNVLYRNNGDGTFTDVTRAAGVAIGEHVGAGACFLDIDKDGDLDLFVANYINFSLAKHQSRLVNGHPAYVGPMVYGPVASTLFRNNGDGTFTDISRESGIAEHLGTGMGVVCADYDDDGDTDIIVGNDVEFGLMAGDP
ncbi:MAG TPA: VCBS repeat-containing protein, partial [Pirellulaceae bacterium]|nr:VCBS repeat-containing protein [Pirellulaceae bacterium]